ncbi:ADP-heptose:LPS heptosyltransferase [Paraburkholderia sp. MM6662-R1]
MMRANQLSGCVATLAVVLSPAVMLSIRGGTGYCFFVIFALALAYLGKAGHRRCAAALFREHRLFVLGLIGMPAVVLFQIAVFRSSTFPALDPFLRLALVVPSFFYLGSLAYRQLRLVQWGFVAGALGVGTWAIYAQFHPAVWVIPGRLGNSFTNPIPFGDTALLLGFLSIVSITRGRRARITEVAIKIAAFLLGGYASYLSGSRGGWIAVALLVWTTVGGRHWLARRRARITLSCAIVAFFVALGSTSMVRQRVDATVSDIKAMQQGKIDTSLGLRLQLWRASALLYSRHPAFGVGRGRLEEALNELAQRGEAPRAIVNAGAHSEFFSTLSQMGTVGVAALLLLYVGTFTPFWRNRLSADGEIATASYLGLAVVGSTIIFGLTIDALTLVMSAAFFALNVATLLACIEARKREIGEVDNSRALKLERPPRTILVACPRRIGDVLMVTPLIRSMKTQWPEAMIDMIVFRGTEGVLEHNPDLRRVITVAQRVPLRERIADAAGIWRRYDLACAATDSDRALIYTWLAGRKRIGLVNADRVKWFARLMLHRIALDWQLQAHVVSNTLELALLVGVTPRAEVVAPGIGPDPGRRARFEARLNAPPGAKPGQPMVVLHLCPKYGYKQWTVDGWAATIRWLRAHGFAVALSGGPAQAERTYAAQVVVAAGEPVLNLVGELTFGETAEMIRRAKLFIGPDTGTTHVAAACGTLTIALFGPGDPVRWGPWPWNWPVGKAPWARRGSGLRGNVYLLQGESECVPCRQEGCGRHKESTSDCLTGLRASRVIPVAAQLLGIQAPTQAKIVDISR